MDFLSSLLDRAAPQAPNVLQRRRPGRFEPLSESAHSQGAVVGLEEAHSRMGQVDPPGPNLQDTLPPDPGAAIFNTRPPTGTGIPAAAEPGAARHFLGDEWVRLAAALSAPPSGPSRHELMSAGVADTTPTQSNGPHPAVGSAGNLLDPQRAVGAARADTQVVSHPAAIAADPIARPMPAVPRSAQRPTAAGPLVSAVATSQGALQPRLSPLPPPAAASSPARRAIAAAEPLPPTVHVSIGRIDIRAVNAGSAGPKPSRSTQANGLSLDDYLKSRNGSQR